MNVSLVVSDNPFLTVTSTQLAFSAQFGGTAPPVQGITVGSTIGGDTLNFSATATSSQSWLTVSPSGGATATASAAVSVGINQSVLNTLPIGTYTGTVTIAPTNGDPYSIVIPVTLTVGASSSLFAAPSSLVFSYETSQLPPAAQTVELLTSGPNLGFTITTSVSGGTSCGTANWLSAVAQQSPLETPNTVIVSVNTAGMTTGSCFGTVRLAYTGASGPTETDVQVTLFVSTSSLLTISLPQGFGLDTSPVETSPGGGLIQHQIAIGSTDASALQYSVTYQSAPCAWLSAGPNTGGSSGTSPTPILVQILPGCITTPGNYSGSVTISSPGLPTPVMFTLNLVVTSNVSVAVTPQSLTFNQSQGGPAPAAQTLSFTVSGGNAPFRGHSLLEFQLAGRHSGIGKHQPRQHFRVGQQQHAAAGDLSRRDHHQLPERRDALRHHSGPVGGGRRADVNGEPHFTNLQLSTGRIGAGRAESYPYQHRRLGEFHRRNHQQRRLADGDTH